MRVRSALAIFTFVILFTAASVRGEGPTTLRPYTVDDYLALESTGGAAGAGRLIVWEQAPPYDRIGYYGHSAIGAWGSSGFQLKVVDLDAPEISARPLFPPEPRRSYWIDSISPDAKYVAFYTAKDGVYTMGVYDVGRATVKSFAATPLVSWFAGRESVWVSSEEFIFSAYANDAQPLDAARPYTGHRLAKEWEKAWAGELSVSTDTSNLEDDGAPKWKGGRLFRANARTGALTLLADGAYESLKVSADGRYLAALRQAELPPADPKKPNVDWLQSRSQLTLFDLRAGGPAKTIAPDQLIFIETLAWAPDSNRLAFFAWNPGESVQSGLFYAVDAESRAITPYPHNGLDLASERERGFSQKPERVMWVDRRLAVLARRHDGHKPLLTYRDITPSSGAGVPPKADWFLLDANGKSENLTERFKEISPVPLHADASAIVVLADGDVWRVGPRRQPRNLTAAIAPALVLPASLEYSTVHRRFSGETILVSQDAARPGFALLDFTTDKAALVPSPAPDAEFLAGAVKAGALLFRHDHPDGADLVLARAGGRTTVLDTLNERMASIAKSQWTTISHKVNSHAGERTLRSCLLLPPDYQPGRRYPVIVEIYPNRGGNCTRPDIQTYVAIGRRPGPYSEHLLAARGYIVFQPNTSAEVIQTKDGPLGGMADVVEQGLTTLVDQGYADPDRIGLLGVSQGGFSSLWLATQSKIFKATVTLNGWSDMYIHYSDPLYLQNFYSKEFAFTGSALRYETTAGTDFPIGKKPYEDPLAYIRPSPLFQAPNVTAPILLIHSDMDSFALHQYERMFVALNLQGKKAKMLRYWGEGHGPSSPANIRHMWTEIFAWFDRYVKGSARGAGGGVSE